MKVAIDADTLVYKSCYRHFNGEQTDIEKAYMEFCYEIGKVKDEVYRQFIIAGKEKIEPIVLLSPKKTFRNKLSKKYKEKRRSKIEGIPHVKNIIYHRLRDYIKINKVFEADDIARNLSKKGIIIASGDKDVYNACETKCYNYLNKKWYREKTEEEIEKWYWELALSGDTEDGITGAKGIGEKFAKKHMEEYEFSWEDFIEKFDSEDDAIKSMQLVRTDQWKEGKEELELELWLPEKSLYIG